MLRCGNEDCNNQAKLPNEYKAEGLTRYFCNDCYKLVLEEEERSYNR